MTTESQKAFETWYTNSKQPNIGLGHFGVTPHGTYAYQSIQLKFIGFQAAREHIRAKLQSEEVVEKVAIQLSKLQNSDDVVWDDMHKEKYQEKFLTVAKAAIAAVLEHV